MSMDRYLRVAIEAARESGRLQMASLGKVHRIRFKGEINLVTEVDHRSEAAIVRRLRRAFPGVGFLTEESGVLAAQGKTTDGDRRWIIDPLDGTTNFAHGYPLFCTSIALEVGGKVVVGVVYEPNRDELFWSIAGRGAFRNGKRLRVSRIVRLRRALLSTGFAYNVQRTTKNNLTHFRNFLMTAQAVRRDGVAAIDLCYVAAGRYDGFWEIGLWPWDVAASVLILKEAGGRATLFDGKAIDIYRNEIVASNGKIHHQMLKVIRRGL